MYIITFTPYALSAIRTDSSNNGSKRPTSAIDIGTRLHRLSVNQLLIQLVAGCPDIFQVGINAVVFHTVIPLPVLFGKIVLQL